MNEIYCNWLYELAITKPGLAEFTWIYFCSAKNEEYISLKKFNEVPPADQIGKIGIDSELIFKIKNKDFSTLIYCEKKFKSDIKKKELNRDFK